MIPYVHDEKIREILELDIDAMEKAEAIHSRMVEIHEEDCTSKLPSVDNIFKAIPKRKEN